MRSWTPRFLWTVFIVGFFVSTSLGKGQQAVEKETPRPDKETFMVRMSDGVRLATDVWRPQVEGVFPVLLARTPYNKNFNKRPGLVEQGYVFVSQDMRGRFASEGENIPFIGCGWQTHQDGVETVAWILKQKWCNGKVGTVGGSALGIAQNLLAGAEPTSLACQYIRVASASWYHDAVYVGGALRQSQIEKWLEVTKFDPNTLIQYRAHPAYGPFWYSTDTTRKFAVMNTPALHFGGWFDIFSQGTIDSFCGRQYHGAKGARGTQKLVMGPWAHSGYRADGKVGELQFPNADIPSAYSQSNWLRHYLKGEDVGVEKLPAVAYYVMGDIEDPQAPGNEWRYAPAWPIPAEKTKYYLHLDGNLSRDKASNQTAKPTYVEYTFDPQDPCPTIGGCNLMLPPGPRNQNPIENRADVLCFTTEPFTDPVEVTGNVLTQVYLSSSAVDTDLSVRFCDVYPDGKSYLMAEGMLRLHCRDGFDKVSLMKPQKVYEVSVACWPTSVVINQGHRIRITLTSSNFPRFDVNPGTGQPLQDGSPMVKQTNRIYISKKYPSRVIFPLVKP